MSGGGKFGFAGYASINATPPPATTSLATSASGSYDEACTISAVGTGVTQFESGSNFSSGTCLASLTASGFNTRRDRSMGFGVYCRNGASVPAYSYTLAQTATGGLWTGLICDSPLFPSPLPRCSYNQQQDNLTVGVPGTPDGYPDGGVGKYVAFTGPPTALDNGTETLKCVVTDGGGTYATTNTLTMVITFT
tara:strand:+ start:973 stop:1551 length:579 start_codon:yes stop_codon:yes gene_type:complete